MLLICVNLVSAQDLITESQAAIPPNQNLVPNQIFRDINSLSNSFVTASPLKISTDGSVILKSYQSLLENGVVLEEQNGRFEEILRANNKNLTLNIPVGNNKFIKLKLEKTDIFTDDFVFRYGNSNENNNTNGAIFYRGVVDRKPLSSAAISITANSIRGVISDEFGNYTLSSLTDHPNKYLLYNEKALKNSIPFNGCGSENESPKNVNKKLDLEEGIRRTHKAEGDCVEIYFECDYSMYEAHSYSVRSVKEYVTALFNEISILYYNENINIYISEIYVWTSPDPYRDFNNSYEVLDAFGGQVKDNYNGRLAHLLTRRGLGEGGRAWVDVLCDSHYTFTSDINGDGIRETRNAGPYGVSTVISNTVTPFNTYSWDVFILAHELGHNFGSPHTHACKWGPNGDEAIDNCWYPEGACSEGPEPIDGGTIMSYCNSGYAFYSYGINFKNGFGEQPGNLMRSRVNSSDCLNKCPCGARANKDVNVFENYIWLNSYVDRNNCDNEVVTLYNNGSFNYIYVENDAGGILYNEEGRRYCTSRSGLDCIAFYNLNQIDGTWACTAAIEDCGLAGCTDVDACNYDPQAELNDGSCDFGATQCDDPCSSFTGCTNPAAINYNSSATCNDGSCEFPEGCDADVFTDFSWLNTVVNEINCGGEKITSYRKGAFNYIYVEFEDEGVLYYNGSRHCSDRLDGFCVNAYNLTEIEKEWSCNDCMTNNCPPQSCSTDPCTNGGVYTWNSSTCSCVLTQSTITGCDDPAAINYNSNVNCANNSLCDYENAGNCTDTNIFSSYNWLNGLVDRNNCTNENITRYIDRSINYIYVNTSNTGYLLYENGSLACSDNGDKRCPRIYGLSEITACWSCGGQTTISGCTDPAACNYNPNATISTNSCNFGNQSCNNPCAPSVGCTDNNACNFMPTACLDNGTCEYDSCENCSRYTGQIYYEPCNGFNYYFIRLTDGTVLDPYNVAGLVFDYPDGATVNFDYRNYTTNQFCNLADKPALITCIEVVNNATNPIFDDYSFLSNVIDPVNCSSSAYVEVFKFSTYSYLYVFDGQSGKLYLNDGTRYCSDRTNTTCKQLYNLGTPSVRWNCGQAYAKRSNQLPTLKVDIFPNPNTGEFTFKLNNEVDLANASIKIYNTSGQALQTIKNIKNKNNINLTTYGKGLYWIELITPNNSIINKVIVQ